MIPWLNPHDQRRELERITDVYSRSCFQLSPSQGGFLLTQIRPAPEKSEQGRLLEDLQLGHTVGVGRNGGVRHRSDDCLNEGKHPETLSGLRLPNRSWLIELAYPPAPGNPFPIHPRARVVLPNLDSQVVYAHPHMHKAFGARIQDAWACPLPPHSTEWQWYPGATLAYLDQVAIWVLKTEVWLATGGGIGQLGVWLGESASHEPGDVLAEVNPQGPCRCGRGLRYAECHLVSDLAALSRDRSPGAISA